MSTSTMSTVPIRVWVEQRRVVVVEVFVTQTDDVSPSSDEWPDVPSLYARAVEQVQHGEGLLVEADTTALRWEAEPSREGEPWRPLMFGGRL